MTTISQSEFPMFEARDIGGTWDIIMRIPHVSGHGATVERILIADETCGIAPDEKTVATRTAALLNMAAHIDTEDLFIKGATLKLETFSERMAAQSGCEIVEQDLSDREQDLNDTNESLRRALRIIGNKFGIKLSADSEMFARKVVEEFEAIQGRHSQVNYTITELRDILGQPDATLPSLLTHVRNFKENAAEFGKRADKAISQLEHIEKMLIEHEHHTEGVELWTSVDKLIDRVQVLEDEDGLNLVNVSRALDESREANKETAAQLAKADGELAASRGLCNEAYSVLKEIAHLLGVTVEEPKALLPVITKLCNNLTSLQSEQTTIQPFKIGVMQLCMIEPTKSGEKSMLPSLPELLEGIRDYVNVLTSYRGGALILHDKICELLKIDSPATEALPYAHKSWQTLADYLDAEFNAPRKAWLTMLENFDLNSEPESLHWTSHKDEIYHFIKGLTVAQHNHDQQLLTLLNERNTDRSIIGAVDDLLGDTNRPAAPLVAAVRALVRSHLIATERN